MLMDINVHGKMYSRATNRVLLDVIDFGAVTEENQEIPVEGWRSAVGEISILSSYDFAKFTEIHLPKRIKGKWMLLVCDPEARAFTPIVFDEWDWNNAEVVKALDRIAVLLRKLVIEEGLKLPWSLQREKVSPNWIIPVVEKTSGKTRCP
jgi:hypothetical protein